MRFLQPGRSEGFKALWHGGLLIFNGGAAIYNGAAWLARRERHLAINAGLYTALTAFELHQLAHHAEACPWLTTILQRLAPTKTRSGSAPSDARSSRRCS